MKFTGSFVNSTVKLLIHFFKGFRSALIELRFFLQQMKATTHSDFEKAYSGSTPLDQVEYLHAHMKLCQATLHFEFIVQLIWPTVKKDLFHSRKCQKTNGEPTRSETLCRRLFEYYELLSENKKIIFSAEASPKDLSEIILKTASIPVTPAEMTVILNRMNNAVRGENDISNVRIEEAMENIPQYKYLLSSSQEFTSNNSAHFKAMAYSSGLIYQNQITRSVHRFNPLPRYVSAHTPMHIQHKSYAIHMACDPALALIYDIHDGRLVHVKRFDSDIVSCKPMLVDNHRCWMMVEVSVKVDDYSCKTTCCIIDLDGLCDRNEDTVRTVSMGYTDESFSFSYDTKYFANHGVVYLMKYEYSMMSISLKAFQVKRQIEGAIECTIKYELLVKNSEMFKNGKTNTAAVLKNEIGSSSYYNILESSGLGNILVYSLAVYAD